MAAYGSKTATGVIDCAVDMPLLGMSRGVSSSAWFKSAPLNWLYSEWTHEPGPQIHSLARDLTSELICRISLAVAVLALIGNSSTTMLGLDIFKPNRALKPTQ